MIRSGDVNSLPKCPGPLGRRELLRFGLAGLGSLSLPELLNWRAQARAASSPEPTALIVVWLQGGASHLETYDPKPLAASDYRGPFSPIHTNAEGLDICELLPHHARVADRFSILRSMVHSGFCHQQGTQQLFTGHPVRVLKQKPDHPDLLSITHRLRSGGARNIPNYVGIPPTSYFGSAYLGPSYEPFSVSVDPNAPDFNVPNIGLQDAGRDSRVRERIDLRKKFDQLRRDVDDLGQMRAFDTFESLAWNMLTSAEASHAFDIRQEDAKTRDRYGRNRWGQQCLLARRLVEAGVDLVTTQFSGPLCGRVGNWDDHAVNHNVFEGMKHRCRFYDQAVAALIEDIYDRGLDRRVMVVVTGEFGRTPKINYQASTGGGIASANKGTVQPGRDHWPRATSMLFSGGGIRTGQVIGATDIRGEDATDHIVGRGDFLATLYRHLGVDAEHIAFDNFAGRPIPILPEGGTPIPELLSRS
ncbi:MAG: DUF1501 domain-containing protein [Planctomycetes bacterium]|nr:DUF1501 domain-containing protein [Planctomycetota bacterium]